MSKGEPLGGTNIKDSYGPIETDINAIYQALLDKFYPSRIALIERHFNDEARNLFETRPHTPQAIVDRVMLEGLSLAIDYPILSLTPRIFDAYTVRRYSELMYGHSIHPGDHILLMGSGLTVPEVVGHTIMPPGADEISKLYRKQMPNNDLEATPKYLPDVTFLAVDPFLPDQKFLQQQFDQYHFPPGAVETKSESLANMIKYDSFGRIKFNQIWMHQAEPLAFSSAIGSLISKFSPVLRGTVFSTHSQGGAARRHDEVDKAQRALISSAGANIGGIISAFSKRLVPQGVFGLTVGNGNDRNEYHQRIALMPLLKASLVGSSRLTTRRLCFEKGSPDDPDAMNADEIRIFTNGNIDRVVGYVLAEKQ